MLCPMRMQSQACFITKATLSWCNTYHGTLLLSRIWHVQWWWLCEGPPQVLQLPTESSWVHCVDMQMKLHLVDLLIICFQCQQDPPEHIFNSISGGNQDNDVAFLKSVVASKNNTKKYDNVWLHGADCAGKKCNCKVFLDLCNENMNFNIFLHWLLVWSKQMIWSRAIYKCEEHEDHI